MDTLLANLSADNLDLATEAVGLYLKIRGFGPVKESALATIRPQIENAVAATLAATRRAA